jgi:hypothetical protein
LTSSTAYTMGIQQWHIFLFVILLAFMLVACSSESHRNIVYEFYEISMRIYDKIWKFIEEGLQRIKNILVKILIY